MYIPDHFTTNPFEKHIYKLEQIAYCLLTRQTVGGLPIQYSFTDQEKQCIDAALKSLEAAIAELKKMDSRKGLVR